MATDQPTDQPTDQTPDQTPNYPITITRQALIDARACPEDLAAFDAMAPDGVLTIASVDAHVGLLTGPLADYEGWAIEAGLLAPIMTTAGEGGTATAGYRGTATAGDYGTATAGDYGTARAGYRGTALAGDWGTATAGDHGTATAGDHGNAIAGDYGDAVAWYGGTATVGRGGTASAREGGIIEVQWYDAAAGECRQTTGYVGEEGIEAGVKYRCDDQGRLVRADGQGEEA